MNSSTLTIDTAALMTLAQDLLREDADNDDESFVMGRANGIGSLHSELLRWARRPAQTGAAGSAELAAGSAGTRMDASFGAGAGSALATPVVTSAYVPETDYGDYVRSCRERGIVPCSRDSFDAEAVRTGRAYPAVTNPALLPQTGIKVADITRVQRELASLAAGGNKDLAATCVLAQAVIEGLLSGLAVEQLS